MTKRTHFRCRAFGLLSVAQCQTNRQLPASAQQERSGRINAGALRPLACRGCLQADAVETGREPSLVSLAEAAAGIQTPPPQARRITMGEVTARQLVGDGTETHTKEGRMGVQTRIIAQLTEHGPVEYRALAAALGLKPKQTSDALFHLKRAGRVTRGPGGLWRIAAADKSQAPAKETAPPAEVVSVPASSKPKDPADGNNQLPLLEQQVVQIHKAVQAYLPHTTDPVLGGLVRAANEAAAALVAYRLRMQEQQQEAR